MEYSPKRIRLYDGGTTYISSTNVADIGRAVVGVLEHPTETRNRRIFVQSTRFTQLELLEIVEKHAGVPYERDYIDTAELAKKGFERVKNGDMAGLIDTFPSLVFAEGRGSDFDSRKANPLVGVRELSKDELSHLVGEAMASVAAEQKVKT